MSDLQHPDARSFEQVADVYERRRPTYPDEAVDWLVREVRIGPSSTVLDLGAGTGKLTRALVPRVQRVIAVEPGSEMLARLREAVPAAEALVGAAEAIPLDDSSVDAVVCGQSFHWFRVDEARREIRRVLRSGCGLGLIWNVRDPNDDLQNEITALLDPLVPVGRATDEGVRAFVLRTFDGVSTAEFTFALELDADAVVEGASSTSFVASASAAERAAFLDALRDAVVRRGGRVSFRYRTEAYVTFEV